MGENSLSELGNGNLTLSVIHGIRDNDLAISMVTMMSKLPGTETRSVPQQAIVFKLHGC